METPETVFNKVSAWCAQTEHCTQEVVRKLSSYDLSEEDIAAILDQLRADKFLDDARYALNFVQDKWNLHAWGRVKMRHHLEEKEIPVAFIDKALASIPEEEYRQRVFEILNQKMKRELSDDRQAASAKVMRFGMGRGYEEEVVGEWGENI